VTVPLGSPKSVTLIYPYYENAVFFMTQVAGWRQYPASVASHLSAIVVDDGSPVPAVLPDATPFPLALYRIGVDVRWNWLAARNIGAHHAADGWMLLSDMDHVVPAETAAAIVYGQHDPSAVYAFSRRDHTGETVSPHSASFLMTRAMFWTIGGYDETLSGHYGTDGDYRRRLAEHARIRVLSDVLVRHEYQGDSSTTRYLRKQPEDAAVSRIVQARRPHWHPKVLSFPYTEVTA
jgi:hypothetical protein